MTAREDLRKGWCPGALRPMQTGDGLLVRVKPRAGAFKLEALKAIADAAGRFGSGEIDLTNRANLQLRGLSNASYEDAIVALGAAGLIDRAAAAEAVRNVVVDPLSGLDPDRRDMRPLATELERLLAERRELHALPGKFGFSLSGRAADGGSQTTADITVTAAGHEWCAIWLDGEVRTVARVGFGDALSGISRLASAFLTLTAQHSHLRRMRDAVAVAGSSAIFLSANLEPTGHSPPKAAHQDISVGLLGPETAPFAVGVGLPFGRISAADLLRLCEAASAPGCTDVRLSPARVLVFPACERAAASALIARAESLGLITHGSDARLVMDVCPGAPACRNATTTTRADAVRLVAALAAAGARVPQIHISGCQKGCARRTPAALTFVARDGNYDLVRNGTVDGPAALSRIAPSELAAAAAHTIAKPAT